MKRRVVEEFSVVNFVLCIPSLTKEGSRNLGTAGFKFRLPASVFVLALLRAGLEQLDPTVDGRWPRLVEFPVVLIPSRVGVALVSCCRMEGCFGWDVDDKPMGFES